MSSNKATNSQKVGLMAAGAVGAVALAYWSISNALAPTPTAPQPAPPANMSPATLAPTPAAHSSSEPMAANSEALLAPAANPFVVLSRPTPGNMPQRAMPVVMPVVNSDPPSKEVRAALPPLPPPASEPAPVGAVRLKPLGVSLPPMPGALNKTLPGAVATITEPELVGTLLGDRPSGVFRVDKRLAIVPVGETIGGWKVLTISHGEAVLKSGRRMLRLEVVMGKRQDLEHS